MVIIFDNNEYRRENLYKLFKMANFPMISRDYEYYSDYTKPLLTILINPNPLLIDTYLKEKNTKFLIVAKKDNISYKKAKYVIINEELKVTPEDAKNIIMKEYGFDFYQDCVNFITIVDDEEEKDIYFGGHKLNLTNTEFYILRFFAYQRFKTFDVDMIREYLFMQKRLKENSLECIISTINGKCRDVNREKIILKDTLGYRITEVTGVLPWCKNKNPYF